MGASGSSERKFSRKGDVKSENDYVRKEFKLSDDQIKEYRSLFDDHSSNKKGITKEEFKNVYKIIYTSGDVTDFADRVFAAFDTDKNGTVDFIEFAAGLTMMESEMIEQKISIAFHMYDEDGSNSLTQQEVINMIQAYYRMLGPNDSRSPVQIANDLFAKMDLNKDSKVTFEEFSTVAKENPMILDILNPKEENQSKR